MKRFKTIIIVCLAAVGALTFSHQAHAQVFQGGGLSLPEQTGATEIRGITHESSLINLIIGWTNFMLPYVNVLSVFAIVAAGMMYILSFTNDELHSKAKTILIYVVIGIVLVYSAFTIVNTLLSVGAPVGTQGGVNTGGI